MTKERNNGVDCLRFMLMFMVCILHVLGQGGILSSNINGSLQYAVFWLIDIVCFCSVDSFAFISGYVATDNRSANYTKLIGMWFQVFFYTFFLSLILKLFGVGEIGGGYKELVKLIAPVTGKTYWYFTAYFVLSIIKPYLNIVLFSLRRNQLKTGFIILFILFSLQGFLGDPYKSSDGYSAIWLIVLYCMGVITKRGRFFEKYNSRFLVILFCLNSVFTLIFFLVSGNGLFIKYTSPTILFNGIYLVIIFSRMKVGKIGNLISKYSLLAFGIYLFQLNPVIWNCLIKDAFVSIANSEIYIGILQVFGYASLILVSGLILEIIRDRLFTIMKVNKLAEIVNDIIGLIVSKSTVLLGCVDDIDCNESNK